MHFPLAAAMDRPHPIPLHKVPVAELFADTEIFPFASSPDSALHTHRMPHANHSYNLASAAPHNVSDLIHFEFHTGSLSIQVSGRDSAFTKYRASIAPRREFSSVEEEEEESHRHHAPDDERSKRARLTKEALRDFDETMRRIGDAGRRHKTGKEGEEGEDAKPRFAATPAPTHDGRGLAACCRKIIVRVTS